MQTIQQQVLQAIADKTPLQIIGGNSKAFYGREITAKPLHVSNYQGVIHYEPSELVLTARCGTRLSDIELLLAEHGQMLAFEPPHFADTATLGGVIATGLSGSRRAYAGAVRDVVLGVRLINGLGEIVKFGGEVMKNVAGFDVSRLQVGALGTLGVLLDISLKVLPRPETELTLVFELEESKALSRMVEWGKKCLPLSGLCFVDGCVYLRLSGAELAIKRAKHSLGGIELNLANEFWLSIREQQHGFFQSDLPLWRLSLAPATPQLPLSGSWLIDWGGALRWLKTEESPDKIFSLMNNEVSGHACRFRSVEGCLFQPLNQGVARLQRNVKQAFDPHGIFNCGRMYALTL
jgi:glycolate oxidase FAD binding subunit